MVARPREVAGHGATHDAEADESEIHEQNFQSKRVPEYIGKQAPGTSTGQPNPQAVQGSAVACCKQ